MYYKLPFDFSGAIAGGDAELSSGVAENIAQHIQILITTKRGEHRFDPDYGNAVWELEFENALSDLQWEERFRRSLLEAILRYEPRITDAAVSIHVALVEREWPIQEYTEIKKRVVVIVNARLRLTGEKFGFRTELYLSPLSVD